MNELFIYGVKVNDISKSFNTTFTKKKKIEVTEKKDHYENH